MSSMSFNPTSLIPGPPCAAVSCVDAKACLRSVFQRRDEHVQWRFVIESVRPGSFDTPRVAADEAGEVSSKEGERDHKAPADYGKIGFGDAERGRDDYGAAHVGVVSHARDEVSAYRAKDAGSVAWMLVIVLWRRNRS